MKAVLRSIAKKGFALLGWKSKRKLIVFTSDDWGSIRVESNEIREQLIADGFSMQSNRFNAYDTLESNTDLELLFEVLIKYKDSKGNHPVFTALTNVANPDFEKIKENDFKEYFFEPFTTTLKRYPNHDQVEALYQEGIRKNIFVPEFHGREHLNVASWMKALRMQDKKTHQGFDAKFFFIEPSNLPLEFSNGFGAAFLVQSEQEIQEHQAIIASGLSLFEQLFNYKAILFTAPSQVYSTKLEPILKEKGLQLLDVPLFQSINIKGNSFLSKFNYTGKSNKSNQKYIIRNAVFEPNMYESSNGVMECLQAIEQAFLSHKPAIISNHRAAFVGGLDINNRVKGLKALDELFQQILLKWPDAEFISAAELNRIMNNKTR
jgi:hypothetical protein